MDFMVHFTMGTGGHYITMLPANWSISTSHDPLPSSCYSKKMLWNPSIEGVVIGRDPCCEIKIMKISLEQGFED